jgi:H+/Cl- antiporter ClcA
VIDADADEKIWLVVLALALAFSALIAVAYVVYSAPVLLTEVALDAESCPASTEVSVVHDDGNWVGAVWRRTWLPALIVIVCVSGAGYFLQRAVPDARSIGGVIRALSE